MPFTKLRQSLIKPYGSITGSLSGTSSYARRAITASYALNASGGGGSTLTTGSTYPITSSYARRAITASYASRALTSSYLLGGSQILTANKTVSFSSSFTTAQMQSLIDAQPKNLNGYTLTFKFADGNYNLSTGLIFRYFSNGEVIIRGNTSNNTVAAAKSVTLSGSIPIQISHNSTFVEVGYLRLSINTSTFAAALTVYNSHVFSTYCSYTNHPRSVAAGSGGGVASDSRASVWVSNSYFTSLDRYMVAGYSGIIYSYANSRGTSANVAYLAYGGIVQVQDTGLTATTTYSTAVGGLIVRPSGTTVGT